MASSSRIATSSWFLGSAAQPDDAGNGSSSGPSGGGFGPGGATIVKSCTPAAGSSGSASTRQRCQAIGGTDTAIGPARKLPDFPYPPVGLNRVSGQPPGHASSIPEESTASARTGGLPSGPTYRLTSRPASS